jgi:transposase InsO family protein
MTELKVSERRACKVLEQPRSTQRRKKKEKPDEELLREAIVKLACDYGRYGYRRITALLKAEGWRVNHKRVERVWREEGLKVPKKQPKRKRLWLNDGSTIRLKPMYKNHVWSYDFVHERTSDGKAIRILNIIDEYTRECLAIHIKRQIEADEVLFKLSELFITHGVPEHIRSDNGTEFTAESVRLWLQRLGVTTLFIEPGSPWENGYIESFNGKLRDELLNGEIFDTIFEAQVITEKWRQHYNRKRPHSSLNFRPPVPEVIIPHQFASA